ncbi:Nif3-like dinuclear metal center hexameric protein [Marinobacterium sp. AK62]|uniref:Nif3-like dinuclear metal center hexameric protein n=1 Tax=Marinobacterium alkalitolerans TaxID=1542925 RepID=A0ABS3ZBT2_9GAMM|nr:Nif3-like dinuclear metal center hexameric protein [Marinobacterium alkalitolerans]MBP0048780.1 Nif3-like dinuclear metal center hexameric protein [Marinobacterium alkalitolerans]
MSTTLKELQTYIDQLLEVPRFKDYCPNGLQVEGRPEISRVLTGVTASQALLDEAVQWQADLVLVHHGYFWKGEAEPITGIKRRRIQTLLAADINLMAYHLPLDAHPTLGNNAQLAQLLGIQMEGPLSPGESPAIGNVGTLASPMTLQAFEARVAEVLQREPQTIAGGDHTIERVAWCTGAAERMIDLALAQDADLYLSGEISEPVVHVAREAGIHYIGAGHHATERYGVQALGEHLAAEFGLEHRFVDIDNPV